MISDRYIHQGMCFAQQTSSRVTTKRIDCTRLSLNIAVDMAVEAMHSSNSADPSMSWRNCCIHLNRLCRHSIPIRCHWHRMMYSRDCLSIDATECRLTFWPLWSAMMLALLNFHQSEHVWICSGDFETKFWLGSPTGWAYAPVVHVQVPINIAAAENDSPVRALVPARKVRAAFACFEVYHFYAIHNGMMSPLVGCLSLLGIHLEKKKKKLLDNVIFSSQICVCFHNESKLTWVVSFGNRFRVEFRLCIWSDRRSWNMRLICDPIEIDVAWRVIAMRMIATFDGTVTRFGTAVQLLAVIWFSFSLDLIVHNLWGGLRPISMWNCSIRSIKSIAIVWFDANAVVVR